MKKKNVKILMGTVCCILAIAITLQFRTMKNATSNVADNFANDELKDSLLKWKEKYEKASENLEKSTTDLENIRKIATNNDSNSQEKTNQLKIKNMQLGLSNVVGDGIIITLKDAQTTSTVEDYNKSLVHDGDLRGIVSELTNAGAEAISINDERIVSSTCITCAGNVISVNGEKISSPFIIKAIGNQENLYGIKRPGGYIQLLQDDKIPVEAKKANKIEIKKFTGALTQKYMKVKGE